MDQIFTLQGLFTRDNLVALLTLSALEVVLGIDNVVFIAILAGKLPPEQRDKARKIGLLLAMLTRIGLLFSLAWVMRLTSPLFTALGHEVSGKDLVLILGGAFLIAKSTTEIHGKIEGSHGSAKKAGGAVFAAIIGQIIVLDIVFSLDSVITAVGMAKDLRVMIAAVVIAVVVMLIFSGGIARFVDRHPTVKMLALSFLLLIGVMLVADGFGQHIPKGYIYFAMAFSLLVEVLNLAVRAKQARKSTLATGPTNTTGVVR